MSNNTPELFPAGHTYFLECCEEDVGTVVTIASRMQKRNLHVTVSAGMPLEQRLPVIDTHDVVIFFVSQKLLNDPSFEMLLDYKYCEEHKKNVHFVWLDKSKQLKNACATYDATAFLLKCSQHQGISLTSSSPENQALEILSAVNNPQKNEITHSRRGWLFLPFFAAAAVTFLFVYYSGLLPFGATARPLSSVKTVDALSIGRHVTFGTYEQDGNVSNGAEPIEWIVLEKRSDRVLLLSDKLLDYVPYHQQSEAVTWQSCSLRQWLNQTFFYEAFSASERGSVAMSDTLNSANRGHDTDGGVSTQDRVFVLSESEAERYLTSTALLTGYTTDYARGKGRAVGADGSDYWWLRTPGMSANTAEDVQPVNGIVRDGDDVSNNTIAVRPAIWVIIG